MQGYLRLFCLRMVLEEGSLNVIDLTHLDLIRNIRSLKADIRNNKIFAKFNDLNRLTIFNVNKEVIYNIILEDDFIPYIIDSIGEFEVIRMEDRPYIASIISFVLLGINVNIRFILKLMSSKKLLGVVKSIIRSNCLNGYRKFELALLISHVTFQYDENIFRDQAIKEFLMGQFVGQINYVCIGAVVRMFAADELRSSIDVICSSIPKIVGDIENNCSPGLNASGLFSLDLLLEIVKTLCKLVEPRIRMAENFKLFFSLRRILMDRSLNFHIPKARQVLTYLYTEEQVSQIEEDVARQAR